VLLEKTQAKKKEKKLIWQVKNMSCNWRFAAMCG